MTEPSEPLSDRTASGNARHKRTVPEPGVAPLDVLHLLPALLPELRLLIGLISASIIIAGLYFGRDIVVPLALAFLLGFVLDPLVGRLKRLGLARTPAVIVVVVLTMTLVAFAGAMLGLQVRSLSAQLPTYQSNIQHKLQGLRDSSAKPGMFDGAIRIFDAVKAEVDRVPPATGEKPSGLNSATPIGRVQIVDKSTAPFDEALSWLSAAGKPLATAGIVFVFVVLVLLDRVDLRDRLLRLWGGSLHRSTDAMDEAGQRISRYLTMQLAVNFSYGVPMACGLWLIGVPGAILWGAVAALMRFVPYVGPMISAIFPLVLAFAVDPGWSMLVWALLLIGALELFVNNVVEPWLYGASTGLSAISLMVAATFWTAIWGPIGLIMSTPLTVCLLVIGRHLPRLKFLHVLLGSQPALDTPTRIYQRLLSGDVEEAIELAGELDAPGVVAFYSDVGIPVLRMATSDHASVATAQHRHRVVAGVDALIEDLREQAPVPSSPEGLTAVCIGGKWEVDALAAHMLAHALSLSGLPSDFRSASTVNAEFIAALDLQSVKAVCVSFFSPDPRIQAKQACRRLKRHWPHVKVILALWNAPAELLGEAACKALEADAVVTTLAEAVLHVSASAGVDVEAGFLEAPIPTEDAARVRALRASGALDPRARLVFDAISRRVADIFDVELAMVALISEAEQTINGAFGFLRTSDGASDTRLSGDDLNMPRSLSMCGHVVANGKMLVVPDVSKDLRFANNPALKGKVCFYAGAPMRDESGAVIGTLCLLGSKPLAFSERDAKLLEALAADTMSALQACVATWSDPVLLVEEPSAGSSAIVGQVIPSGA